MTGRVAAWLLRDAAKVELVSERDDPAAAPSRAAGSPPLSPEELEELRERLRALGYVN